jgi:hypothetical protein
LVQTSHSSFDNAKLPKENTSHSSRRLSASSIPTKNQSTVTLRLRQERKEIPKIPVLPSQSHD